MKRITTFLLALMATITFASAEVYNGTCGENLTWRLSSDSTLIIEGSGDMTDWYGYASNNPWCYSYGHMITHVILPEGLTSIGGYAFLQCYNITSITIPSTVTHIGSGAFSMCYNLKSITFPVGLTEIGQGVFDWCTSLTEIVIPNTVTTIGIAAFFCCKGLTTLTIPNSVTTIGEDAFYEIPNIVYYGQAQGTPWGARCVNGYVDGDLIYTNQNKETLAVCLTRAKGQINIPNSTKKINSRSFFECKNITSVIIPNSVDSIERETFYGCSELDSVIIGANITRIGSMAFGECYKLHQIILPSKVEKIGEYAFTYCTKVSSITCYAVTPPVVDQYGFFQINTSIPLYVPAESIDAYKAADVWKEFTNILPLVELEEDEINIQFLNEKSEKLHSEAVKLQKPIAPIIEGFTFVKWQVVAGDLEEGVSIQAVYTADEPTSAPAVVSSPANPAQKLIRQGNVYILKDEKTYTIQGHEVK